MGEFLLEGSPVGVGVGQLQTQLVDGLLELQVLFVEFAHAAFLVGLLGFLPARDLQFAAHLIVLPTDSEQFSADPGEFLTDPLQLHPPPLALPGESLRLLLAPPRLHLGLPPQLPLPSPRLLQPGRLPVEFLIAEGEFLDPAVQLQDVVLSIFQLFVDLLVVGLEVVEVAGQLLVALLQGGVFGLLAGVDGLLGLEIVVFLGPLQADAVGHPQLLPQGIDFGLHISGSLHELPLDPPAQLQLHRPQFALVPLHSGSQILLAVLPLLLSGLVHQPRSLLDLLHEQLVVPLPLQLSLGSQLVDLHGQSFAFVLVLRGFSQQLLVLHLGLLQLRLLVPHSYPQLLLLLS